MLAEVFFLCFCIFSTNSKEDGFKVSSHSIKDVPSDLCPKANDIYPCVCTVENTVINMDCSGVISEKQLKTIFSQDFGGTDARKLTIKGNKYLSTLHEGVFGQTQFIEVDIIGTSIDVIEAGVFKSSYNRLEKLKLSDNKLVSFPFEEITKLDKLTQLDVTSNVFQDFPTVVSDTMKDFFIGNNLLTNIPSAAFTNMLNIQRFRAARNKIKEIKTDTFSSLKYLEQVDLTANDISEIPPGTFIFNSNDSSLYISFNAIKTLEQNAFEGVTGMVNFDSNSLELFEEEVWGPTLENGARVSIKDNPLKCDCDIRWLIVNDTLLEQVFKGASCANGLLIHEIDPDYFDYCVTATPDTAFH